jgi:hypothetical protein
MDVELTERTDARSFKPQVKIEMRNNNTFVG